MAENIYHTMRMRQVISDAMIALLEEKPFHKITVQDIMEKAHIQRATFYRYYRDKFELTEAINKELVTHLVESVFAGFYQGSGWNLKVQTDMDRKYRVMLQKTMFVQMDHMTLAGSLRAAFLQKYLELYPDSDRYEAHIAAVHFVFSVVWFAEQNIPPEEVEKYLQQNFPIKWLAKYYNLPEERLMDFVRQNQHK